ncbi:MAG: TetR family transcriptional regulator [Proteobacteria bacterium]|nr:TetR family transcriptional regulator [Pseudomonadota bacterium]
MPSNRAIRTRKDLLDAAGRLVRKGTTPSLEEIAAEALVSRATAYRYFPSAEAVLAEAAVEIGVPDPKTLFAGIGDDPAARVERVDTTMHDLSLAHEAELRLMLVQGLLRKPDSAVPARQNRRTPLIDAALEPARRQFKPAALANLRRALAFFIGTEAMIVAKDVLAIDDAEARKVKRWAIRALVEAAKSRS